MRRPPATILLLAVAASLSAAPAAHASGSDGRTLYERRADRAVEIADRAEQVRSERREHPGLRPQAYARGGGRWQVSYFAGDKELVQVKLYRPTGKVLEAWTGVQVAWEMARGYDGQFGRHVNAPYVWLPLCALFLLPFLDPRRPFRLIHLDLLVLLAFGVSHIFFNRGEVSTSVPLVYPVLVYVLVRMLVAGFRPRRRAERLVPLVPVAGLAMAVIFLVGFRVALNVTDSNVIDVGYSGVIGADRIADGKGLYDGGWPDDPAHPDTYGPVTYLAYVPFEQALPWSGLWDDLPAAHGAALAFDLLTLLGLFLVGVRMRAGPAGRELGVALAYAWVAYPYTLFVLETNANDSLVAMLCVFALLAVTSPTARGGLVSLAAATKFAPAALAPLFWLGTGARSRRDLMLFALAALAVMAIVLLPFLPDGGLRQVYDLTLGFQAGRDSPFSVWGQEPSLDWLQTVVKAGAVGLALVVAAVPRRRTPAQVAALAAAVLVAVELTANHWFYLYVVWFAPLAFVALFAAYRTQPVGVLPPAGILPAGLMDTSPSGRRDGVTPLG
jgi:hypothetical protein